MRRADRMWKYWVFPLILAVVLLGVSFKEQVARGIEFREPCDSLRVASPVKSKYPDLKQVNFIDTDLSAFHKTSIAGTHLSSVESPKHNAQNAIDAKPHTFAASRHDDTDPYIQLDLGAMIFVSYVEIHPRQDCPSCQGNLFPLEVWVGIERHFRAGNSLCAVMEVWDGAAAVVLQCNMPAEFLRVVLPGMRHLEVADIEVYANPMERTFQHIGTVYKHPFKSYLQYPEENTHRSEPTDHFLTFEPWNGGLNNRRFSLELALVLGYLMNRTVVLPPQGFQNHLNQNCGYEDFYDIRDLSSHVPVLSYEQYRLLRPMEILKSDFEFFPRFVDFEFPQQVTVRYFQFRTANDADGRDPSHWRMLIPSRDGFEEIADFRGNPPEGRSNLTQYYDFGKEYTTSNIRWAIFEQRGIEKTPGDDFNAAIQVADVWFFDSNKQEISFENVRVATDNTFITVDKEGPDKLIDNNPRTKMFLYAGLRCGHPDSRQAYDMCMAFRDERDQGKGIRAETKYHPLTEVIAYPDAPNSTDPAGLDDFQAFTVGREVVPFRFKDSSTVVHFPGNLFSTWYSTVWVNSKPLYRKLAKVVKDSVKYSHSITAVANTVIKKLGRYSAIHVRKGDFYELNEEAYNASTKSEAIFRHLHPNETLYVATDTYSDDLKRDLSAYSVYTSKDLKKSFKLKFPTVWLPAIEQLICAGGRVFIGTEQSTFSNYVVRLRGYANHGNTEWLFRSDAKVRHPPRPRLPEKGYSWTQFQNESLRPSFWAVEYAEGWDTPK